LTRGGDSIHSVPAATAAERLAGLCCLETVLRKRALLLLLVLLLLLLLLLPGTG
jgi:hypothetical protein